MVVFFVFLFGTIIGSFLNVVILRAGGGYLSGRSQCFSCGKTLSAKELIPVFSFIYLKGRCLHCRSKISPVYPTVEFLTGLLFALIFKEIFPLGIIFSPALILNFLLTIIIVSSFIVIFFYDAKHKIIPDGAVYLAIFLSLLKLLLFHYSVSNILSGVILFLFFFLIWLISGGRAMGFGDAKLALSIGWFLPSFGAISAIIISFWTGAFWGILLILLFRLKYLNLPLKKLTIKSEMAFGPFMIIGALLVYFLDIDLLGLSKLFN